MVCDFINSQNHETENNKSSVYHQVKIHVRPDATQSLYQYLIKLLQAQAHVPGFSPGGAPMGYIEQVFQASLAEYMQEFLLRHPVRSALTRGIESNKIIHVGNPSLRHISNNLKNDASFIFDIPTLIPKAVNEWKRNLIKAPERKNYKDLDRQVETFLNEEVSRLNTQSEIVSIGDWLLLKFQLMNEDGSSVNNGFEDYVWLRIGDEEADREAQKQFLGKKKGDTFYATKEFLEEYLGHTPQYLFAITIDTLLSPNSFCLDLFKRHFKLKSSKELHQKLIEVFSYRKDLSQRRETVEATFKALNNQFSCLIPNELINLQQDVVLDMLHLNPDYYVYKSQSDFKQKVRELAIKQLKEMAIIDYLAYQEGITIDNEDIASFINLLKRPRTKEFIYFDLPPSKINGQETLIPAELLAHYCLREKTLNHVIHHITKQR